MLLVVNPVHFLLTENIKKGQSRDNYIILFINSNDKRRWINVIFLQDKHNINVDNFGEPHLYIFKTMH